MTIYVVGRNTPVERLFSKTGLADASAYARAQRQTIEALPTADLCGQAVEDVYGA